MNKRNMMVLSVCIFINACGTMPADRSVSGAGIGAGAGAVLGAVTGLPIFGTAALGAAAGAITGVMTNKNQINFGEPAWKQGNNQKAEKPISQQSAPSTSSGDKNISLMIDIQKGLRNLGYDPGPIDGKYGSKTEKAIRDYQYSHGLIVDGKASPSLLAHIEQNIKHVNYQSWS
jgi:osmotically inducible lipoprotein OsmB